MEKKNQSINLSMAEEQQKWQEPGGHRLCANNCDFFGSPTTLNLCSKCYKEHCIKEQQMSTAKLAVEKTLISSEPEPASESGFPSSSFPSSSRSVSFDLAVQPEEASIAAVLEHVPPAAARPNRCSTCRRRVGLTGFTCRCGITFCGTHRYPEQHGCTFDFKTLGKETIAKANPVVKAEKLQKI